MIKGNRTAISYNISFLIILVFYFLFQLSVSYVSIVSLISKIFILKINIVKLKRLFLLVTAQSANSLKFYNEKNLSLRCYYYSEPLRSISYLLEGFSKNGIF